MYSHYIHFVVLDNRFLCLLFNADNKFNLEIVNNLHLPTLYVNKCTKLVY